MTSESQFEPQDRSTAYSPAVPTAVTRPLHVQQADHPSASSLSVRVIYGVERAGHAVPFEQALNEWLMASPTPSVAKLVDAAALSQRQVERRCKEVYGKSPKRIAREVRALRAVATIVGDPAADYDFVELGFYDQSHMIREIKHFTGKTPGQLRADALSRPDAPRVK